MLLERIADLLQRTPASCDDLSRLGRKRPGNLAGSAAAAIFILALAAGECTAGEVAAKPAAAVPIFLDTDVCVDAGDVAAITCLHGLADRGEADILGITCVTSCPYAPGCVDAVCRWCKRPNVPIGALKDRAFLAQSGYAKYMAQHWPNRYGEGAANVPDAVVLFRQAMAQQRDNSVVMVAIGPLRNLAHFLQSKPDRISPLSGRELIAKKVKFLSAMAGIFHKIQDLNPETYAEWNVLQDIPAAQYVVQNWPTPIMFSGFEIGLPITVDDSVVKAAPHSPQGYCLRNNAGRPAWDQTSILYAVRGLSNYWTGAMSGRVEIDSKGCTAWHADPACHQGYLAVKMDNAELGKIIAQLEAEAGQFVSPIHYRPRQGVFADPIPFYSGGEYHVFYLRGGVGNVPWEHIVSKDLVHWRELPPALISDGDPKGPDGGQMFTGSVAQGEGAFHIFYTGHNDANPSGTEFILHATSKDLLHWTKRPADMIAPDGIHYVAKRERDFRDAYVFWNADEKQYWMVLCANGLQGGGAGLAVSPDLKTWRHHHRRRTPQQVSGGLDSSAARLRRRAALHRR